MRGGGDTCCSSADSELHGLKLIPSIFAPIPIKGLSRNPNTMHKLYLRYCCYNQNRLLASAAMAEALSFHFSLAGDTNFFPTCLYARFWGVFRLTVC